MRKKRGVVDVTVHEDDDEEEGGVRGASSRNGGGRRRRGMGSIGSSGIGHGRARQQAASGARDERVGERVPLLAKDDPDETNVSSSFSSFSPHAETRLGVPAASSQRDSLAREEQAARDAELKAIQRKSRRFSESEAEAQLGPLLEEADESSVESQVAHVTTHAHPFDSRPLSTVDDLARQQLVGARPFSGVEEDIDNAHRDLTPDQLIQKLQALPVDFPIGMKRKLQLRRTLLNELRRQGQLEQALPQERRHKQKRALTTAWSSLLPFSRSLYVIESKFGTDVASYYRMMRWLVLTSIFSAIVIIGAVVIPQVLAEHYTPPGNWYRALWGEGDRNTTLLYYGAYQPARLGGYYLPYAYFVAMFVYFMIQLILLVHELVPRLDADKSLNPLPVSSIFLTWDFKVRTRNDAETHRARFKKNMHAALEKGETSRATTAMVVWRTFTFTLALAIVVGVWFGIDSVNKRYANSSDSLEALLPALTLAAVNAIGPTVFWRMARTVERYSPLAVLKLTLLRSFLLRIVSLYVILTSLFGINLSDMQLAQESCWETLIGQELYRVLLVDTGFAFVTVILYDTPRYLIYEHGQGYAMFDFINRNLGPPQFFLTSSILSGIYRQTLIWLGTFYSPLLPFLGAILNTILVVGKSLAMFRVQRPSQYAFDIHNFKQLYIGLLLLSVLLSLSPVVYSLANLTPSPYCGPFRNYTDISSVVTAMISDAPKHLQEALSVLGQPTVVVPVVFVLLIATYYFFRKSQLQAAQFAQAQRLAADTHDAFKLVTRLQRTQPSSSSSQQAQQAQPP